MKTRLSIIISTARDSDGCFSVENPKKHIFEDLFFSIENQIKYKNEVEIVIVDGLFELRNLKEELEKIYKWTFKYLIVPPKNTYWRENRIWHLNSSFNTGAFYSSGDILFFGSDCVHFPNDFLEIFFYYLDQGYYPHAFFMFALDKKLIIKNDKQFDNKYNFYEIPPQIEYNTRNFGYKTTDIDYKTLISNNFFNISMVSEIFLCDGRINNLSIKDPILYDVIDDREIIHIHGSWYYGNMTMAKEDYYALNGYSEYFEGFKGLNDCEIGPRYLRLKKITDPKQNKHILAKDLYAFENIQKHCNSKILGGHSAFIDPIKLYELMEKLQVVSVKNMNIKREILEDVFYKNLDEDNTKHKEYYINNQPNYCIEKYI